MRLFLAIPVPDDVGKALSEYQDALRTAGVRGNRSPAENLHVTLAFIGEYGDPGDVIDALGELRPTVFDLEIRGTGMFSDTLWAGVTDNRKLGNLSGEIRHVLSDAGIPFDRKKFRPHITLMRRVSLPDRISGLPELSPVTMAAEYFSLFRSDTGKHGAVYTELYRFLFDPVN